MASANVVQTSVAGGSQNALALQGDGVFFPKVSTASRLALGLTTSDTGFVVYDTQVGNLFFWTGTAWVGVPTSGSPGLNQQVQYNNNGVVQGATGFTFDNVTYAVAMSGDLTVDTNVLKVDSAGNRVSVNTTTFATDSAFAVKTTAGKFDVRAAGSLSVKLNSDQSMLYNVPTGNLHLFQINDVDAMTLNATGLGVGVSPSSTIHGYSASGSAQLRMQNGTAVTGRTWYFNSFSDGNLYIGIPTVIDALTVTPSANVGIGVTPSAWFASRRVLSIGTASSISGYLSSSGTEIWTNVYLNTAGNGIYVLNNFEATRYYSAAGEFVWETAPNSGPSGAGTVATLTQKMKLDVFGNLILQSSSTPATLTTNGQLTVNATSNTNLRFSYRGSDGVTRVANITLA